MPRYTDMILATALAALAACSSPNIRSPRSYSAPPAPIVRYPEYNPYAPYGEANAAWRPTVATRDGTIVRTVEPSSQADRPAYERAPWASGAQDPASATARAAPAGTF